MRFPLSMTSSITGYMVKQKLAGRKRFPLVLMLEPLHACNLTCTGCGRIREYKATIRDRMSVEDCVASSEECGAPVVSICGGEPLMYKGIEELTERFIARRRHVIICTNAMMLERKLPGFKPSSRLFFNAHIDGMEKTHDIMVEKEGCFAAAVAGIKAAVAKGFQVTTNTTIYKQTEMDEIRVLWDYLSELGVGGFMVSPAYAYEAVNTTNPHGAEEIFASREEVHAKFRAAKSMFKRYKLMASPLYLDFLCGERELDCAAWANPTRNVGGWRGPCYLLGDAHYKSYKELVDATDWSKYGPGNDARCANCLMHCGFEPAAVMSANRHFGDMVRMAMWQLS